MQSLHYVVPLIVSLNQGFLNELVGKDLTIGRLCCHVYYRSYRKTTVKHIRGKGESLTHDVTGFLFDVSACYVL